MLFCVPLKVCIAAAKTLYSYSFAHVMTVWQPCRLMTGALDTWGCLILRFRFMRCRGMARNPMASWRQRPAFNSASCGWCMSIRLPAIRHIALVEYMCELVDLRLVWLRISGLRCM